MKTVDSRISDRLTIIFRIFILFMFATFEHTESCSVIDLVECKPPLAIKYLPTTMPALLPSILVRNIHYSFTIEPLMFIKEYTVNA